jgi:hypothetical protein
MTSWRFHVTKWCLVDNPPHRSNQRSFDRACAAAQQHGTRSEADVAALRLDQIGDHCAS